MTSLAELRALANTILAAIPPGVLEGNTLAALWGMGFVGRWAQGALAAVGIKVGDCFDGNPALAGTSFNGVPIHAADTVKDRAPAFVLITARHAVPQVSARLSGLGIAHAALDALFVARDFARFEQVYDLLEDHRSQSVLRAVMKAMLTGDRRGLPAVFEKDQYFCLPHFCGIEKEIYVDAGAYVGDSIERFIWAHYGVFERIIAFEPGLRQFSALATRSHRLATEWALDSNQIALENAALSNLAGRAGAASQNGQMTNLAIGGDNGTVRLRRLDDYLSGDRITFLKADVEGMEMALLEGAAETIRRHRPKLAICVYHYPQDIPDIAGYIRSIVPDYRFALRHHSPQLLETVLYAWID